METRGIKVVSGVLYGGLFNDSLMISLFSFFDDVHFQIFLKEWLEGIVEMFLEFDEESFVFMAGFAEVSLA